MPYGMNPQALGMPGYPPMMMMMGQGGMPMVRLRAYRELWAFTC
jgi:hypothetical protein